MRELRLDSNSPELNNILKNPITFLTYSILFAADDYEEFQKFKYLAMYSNPELYSKMEDINKEYDTKRSIRRDELDSKRRQEQIDKDIKEAFNLDFKTLTADDIENDEIIEF